ncbi:MAG: carboxypeptidase-like regulatory domain-containing protein, partial [Psychrosphaera sp.]|nr:carboxypeptidase-like regulatory domain-containing protein [Psychrosphaera sp.]
LPLVKIKSDTLGYSALSFPGGSFRLSHPAANNVTVTYSANGYDPVSKVVDISQSDIVELDIALKPSVVDPAFNLDIDGNGEVQPFTDGILLIRYLFGFRDSILVTDAIAADATLTESLDIEDYIQRGVDSGALDIDGNGRVDPFTDGLLCLRYMFGFRGAILIDQVVAADATSTTAVQIEATIGQLY